MKMDEPLLNKAGKMILVLVVIFITLIGLQVWHPWQRQPVVFYEPLIYPVEVITGDMIVASDNSGYILVPHNETINSIEHDGNKTTIKATRH